ncbi:MAG TPA: NfeD family protein [Nodosilinea sp.]|nr:NfeD family protein [Nodosilinea sp.]
MPEDLFPEADSPQDVQWVGASTDQPTFPEGSWTGKTAQVEAFLDGPKYQVKFEGVYWTAIAASAGVRLTPGETVTVIGRDGNELVVQALPGLQADVQAPPPEAPPPEVLPPVPPEVPPEAPPEVLPPELPPEVPPLTPSTPHGPGIVPEARLEARPETLI